MLKEISKEFVNQISKKCDERETSWKQSSEEELENYHKKEIENYHEKLY